MHELTDAAGLAVSLQRLADVSGSPFFMNASMGVEAFNKYTKNAAKDLATFFGADGGNRTHMGLLPYDFESYAYTSSATSAQIYV